jgi:hypothetical protein
VSGDCFSVAAQLAWDDPTLLLCHGLPFGRGGDAAGRRFWHAWVETPNGRVIDRSNGLDVEATVAAYYLLGRIDPDAVRRYTYRETLAELEATGHWGPWDEAPAERYAADTLADS